MGQYMKMFSYLRNSGIGIMQILLGFCGYAKIPKEIVQASLHQTALLEQIAYEELSVRNKEFIKMSIEYSKTLTRFLASGRMIG
jgi:hypothetical protein